MCFSSPKRSSSCHSSPRHVLWIISTLIYVFWIRAYLLNILLLFAWFTVLNSYLFHNRHWKVNKIWATQSTASHRMRISVSFSLYTRILKISHRWTLPLTYDPENQMDKYEVWSRSDWKYPLGCIQGFELDFWPWKSMGFFVLP